MLDESLFLMSLSALKDAAFLNLTLLHIALVYVLTYVVYKAFGRYIYFKPQEHASKINRTFLTLSLLVLALHSLEGLLGYLPFLPQYRWIFAISGLLLLTAPLSILMDRVIWRYDKYGSQMRPDWHYRHLPIHADYYVTAVSKSERDGSNIKSWEEEGVESTRENIHSDALLNSLALAVYVVASFRWSYESYSSYGGLSFIFFIGIALPVAGVFVDRAIFAWISLLEQWKKSLGK